MAITRHYAVADNTDTTAGNAFVFSPTDPTSGQKYLVSVVIRSTAGVPGAPTVAGTNGWNDATGFGTPIESISINLATDQAIWTYLITAASATAGTISVTFDTNVLGAGIIIDTATDLGTLVQSDTGTGTGSATADLDTGLASWTNAGNYAYMVASKQNNAEAFSAEGGGDWSVLGTDVSIDSAVRAGSATRVGEDTSPTMTWSTNTNWCCWAGEFSIAGGGGGEELSATLLDSFTFTDGLFRDGEFTRGLADTSTFSEDLNDDKEADRSLSESFTFAENMTDDSIFTRGLRETFAFVENFVVTGEGVDFGAVGQAVKKLVRNAKEYVMKAVQWVRAYGKAVEDDQDPLVRNQNDKTKRYE